MFRSRKIIQLLLIPFILAIIVSVATERTVKTRYSSEIKISSIYSQDTIVMAALKIYLGYDPTTRFLDNFTTKLNFGLNNTKNPCSSLAKNNEVLPLLILKDRNGIKVQFSSTEKEDLSECSIYISNEIKNENNSIITFLFNIIEIKNKSQFIDKRGWVKLEKLLEYYNSSDSKITNITDLNRNERKQFLLKYLEIIIPNREFEFYDSVDTSNYPPTELGGIKELEFFQLLSNNTKVEKKVNNYFLFLGFFIIFLFINISLHKNSINKKKIIRLIKKIID